MLHPVSTINNTQSSYSTVLTYSLAENLVSN